MIHPTAIVSPGAKLGKNITVGAFAIIDDDVVIGDNCTIAARAHIEHAGIGNDNYIGEGSLIGGAPQDIKFKNGKSYVRMGDGNTLREYVTIHRANHEGEATVIGNGCFILTQAHIGHDCKVGNKVTLINCVGMSGHVTVDDCAFISGYTLLHQFTRVGSYVMAGGGTKIVKDIPPFVMVDGNDAKIRGLNKVGLKRGGFTPEKIKLLEAVYSIFFRENLVMAEAIKKIEATLPQADEVKYFVEFIKSSKRGVER